MKRRIRIASKFIQTFTMNIKMLESQYIKLSHVSESANSIGRMKSNTEFLPYWYVYIDTMEKLLKDD